jgi:glutathione synthase
LKLLFVIDPLEALDIDGDTTLALIDEALARGHQAWWCGIHDLSLEQDRALALARTAHVALQKREARSGRDAVALALDELNAVFLRKDPPYGADETLATLICEAARGRTLFVNDPRGIREANEKLFTLRFPDLMPPTVVTRDIGRLRRFLSEQGGAIVVKPLDGRGGEGVFMVRADDPNTNAILETSTMFGRRWTMAQRFLPEARQGDKRILLLDGRVLGAVLRVPRENDIRANLHVGGRPMRATLTERDHAICKIITPTLSEWGLHFVGIDIIGDRLTEINVTSPTGLRQIDALESVHLAADVLDWLQARVARGA